MNLNRGRERVHTKDAPAAIGPYSQAIKANGVLYVSGQIPYDAEGKYVGEGDIEAQTHQVMKNLGAVLKEGGGGFDSVCKTTILLSDMGNFAAVNEVYASYFEGVDPMPARACFAVKTLPKNVDIEIDAIAHVG